MEARKKREEEYKQRQAERKKIEDERQAAWEQVQLAKLSAHPFKREVEICETLIYFCAKNKKRIPESDHPGEEVIKGTPEMEARSKKHDEEIKKGKIEVATNKKLREAEDNPLTSIAGQGKKLRKKREGPSKMYFSDPNALDLDYAIVQQYGKL